MPYRKIGFENGKIYHIVNRSIAKFCIFNDKTNPRFLELLNFYRFFDPPVKFSYLNKIKQKERLILIDRLHKHPQIINILAYSLMPNHFHLLVQQLRNNGISQYARLIQNSFAKFFNTKYDRKGPLFESTFRAIEIENDEQLVHVSRYIHLNPYSAKIINKNQILNYPWSSMNNYVTNTGFVKRQLIIDYFDNIESYTNFVLNNADYQQKLQFIKKLTLDL